MTESRDEDPLAYRSPEAFARLCHQMSGRMHYLNRVAIGESHFAWHMAEALRNLGKAFETRLKDPDVSRAFGDGWEKGTLSEAEQRAFLAQLILDDPAAPVPDSAGPPPA